MAEWMPEGARPIEEDWKPEGARPLHDYEPPTFDGKLERAAAESDLVKSMNPGERLLAGIGKGMYETHLNISDLMSHIPGLGDGKVDPQVFADAKDLSKNLTNDGFGNFGQLTGQTAMMLPAGGAAGAATKAAAGAILPGALSAIAPAVSLAAEGGSQGVLSSEPGRRMEGLKTGALVGAASGVAGSLLERLAQLSAGKQGAIREKVLAKVLGEQESAEHSAAGELGAAVQKGSRYEEQFSRYASDPDVPEELRSAIQEWKASPQSKDLVASVLKNQLGEAPAVAGQIGSKRAALEAMKDGREEAIQKAADYKLSGGEAWDQLKARAIRYGVPAMMGMAGALPGAAAHSLSAGLGGGLAGLVLRPMMHSMKNLARNPAVQTIALRGVEGGANTLAKLAMAAVPESGVASEAVQEQSLLSPSLIAQALRNRISPEQPPYAP